MLHIDEPVIGVVGLGRMGSGVFTRLDEHYQVLAHDIVAREPVHGTHSSNWFPELSALAARVDVLITVLPGPTETEAALSEALPFVRSGALWIDLGSGHPDTTSVLAEAAAAQGVDVVAAPMGGGAADALAGTLTFFVGGAAAAIARARPILGRLSREGGVRLCGADPSDGQVVKLLSNALWFANAIAAAEALLVGQAYGFVPKHLLTLLQSGAGSSVALAEHIPAVIGGDYLAGFGIDRVVEELQGLGDLAERLDVPTAVFDASLEVHARALARYGPELGELLGVRLLEDEAGREIR